MENEFSKLRHQHKQQEQQQQAAAQKLTRQEGREFGSVEEMLRFDAAQSDPPARLASRLVETLRADLRKTPAWWRRWFSSRSNRQ